MRFSEKLICIMSAKGWTVRELARRCDVSPMTVTYWRTGACLPRAIELKKLAKQTGYSMDELFEGEEV